MDGFIKENIGKDRYSVYPSALQQLGISYLGGKNFLIRFKMSTLCQPKQYKFPNEHHMIMIPDIHFLATFLLDIPIPVNTPIKIEWKLQLHGNWMPNGHYFIGIVSNNYNVFAESIWNQTGPGHLMSRPRYGFSSVYGLCGNPSVEDNAVWNGIRANPNKIRSYIECDESNLNSNFKNDETICIEYDGKMNKLIFTRDAKKQLICCIKLKEHDDVQYWYPAISMPNLLQINGEDWMRIM